MRIRALALTPRLILAVSLLSAAPASAADPAYVQAERHGALGRLAELAGEDTAAGAAFEKAYSAQPNPHYLFGALAAYRRAQDWPGAARVCSALLDRPLRAELRGEAERGLKDAMMHLEGDRTRLAVQVTPPGARVIVDGHQVPFGTPAVAWLAPGEHDILVEHPGYHPVSQRVTTNLETPTSVTITLEESTEGLGEIRVASNVGGAAVYLDDKLLGEAPLHGVQRPAGKYELRVERSGFTPWHRTIEVLAGRPLEIDARLAKTRRAAPLPVAAPAPLPEPEYAAPAPAATSSYAAEDAGGWDDEGDTADYGSSEPVVAASSGGEGGGVLGIIGWSLLGTGIAVAGGGGYFTFLQLDAEVQQEEIQGIYDSGLQWCATGDCSGGGTIPQLVGWETATEEQLYNDWFLPQFDTLQKDVDDYTLYSYILYGSGGLMVLTGAALLIVDSMDGGGKSAGGYAKTTPSPWRWTGVHASFGAESGMFSTGLVF